VVFLARKPGWLVAPLDDLAARFQETKQLGKGTKLLRSVAEAEGTCMITLALRFTEAAKIRAVIKQKSGAFILV
jgi:hypothetical protein